MFRTSWFPWRSLRWRNGSPRHLSSSRAGRRHSPLILEPLEDRTALSNFNAATVADLIAYINAANAAGGTNTITLTAPTTSPYDLTAVDNTTDGPTGLPVITGGSKPDTLTIIGNGDTIERSTIQILQNRKAGPPPNFRLFDVAGGASLTLDNVTLQNGLAFGYGAVGGAILNQGTLVLNGVTVQDNIAQGSDGANGTRKQPFGLLGQYGAGGGIYSSGSLTLENGSQILNNQALGGNGGSGYEQGYTGGNGGDGVGGGVVVFGSMTITNSTVGSNLARGGLAEAGQVYGYAPGSPGAGVGGGIFVNASGTVMVTSVNVVSNQAYGGNGMGPGGGGGIEIEGGTVTLSNVTVQGNGVVGIGISGGTVTLSNSIVQGNGGDIGGGVSISGGVVTLSNDTFESNSPSTDGGGIYIDGGTVTLCNDIVESNTAFGVGGGIRIFSGFGATVYIDSFTVAHTINNTDSSGLNGPTANIDGTYILKNC